MTRFRRGLKYDTSILCKSPWPMTYMKLLNMALNVEHDQSSMRKSIAAIGGQRPDIGHFRSSSDREAPYARPQHGDVGETSMVAKAVRGVESRAISSRGTAIREQLFKRKSFAANLLMMKFEGFQLILGFKWIHQNFVSLDTVEKAV